MSREGAAPSRAVLNRQKAAAERLRREVLGADGSLRHPYFRDLRRQLRSFERASTLGALHRACAAADVVYVGDFHAVPDCQRFAADLIEALAAKRRPIALGVEFVYTRQQRQLDRRQAGLIGDATFLRRIHYREEWGYPWEGFAALLDRARSLQVPVHALDVPPRGGFDGLRRRDAHAARRIAAILEDRPRTRLIVLFGESHVSAGHIPRRVRALLGRRGRPCRDVTVFQDPDRLYWEWLSSGRPLPPALKLAGNAWAVFHGSPLAKYESYRQILDRWRDDVPPDEEVDLTPAVHHLIGVLLDWLGIRADRHRLHHRAGWSEDLEDAFPEVYSGPEAPALLAPIYREHRRTRQEIREGRDLLARRGVLYESRSNTLFLMRYLPSLAGFESARFLRAALSGRLFDPPEERWDDPAARAYGAAYNEALAWLGSRLVDPTGVIPGDDEQRMLSASGGSSRETAGSEVAERVRWIEAHRRFETSTARRSPDGLIEPLRRSRLLRRALARDLGARLGEALFERVRSGRLDARGLRALFSRRLSPDGARRIVLRLLRGSGARGE